MTDREIITRAVAIERGLKRYFTGKPCKHGHVAERKVHNHVCVKCANEQQLNALHGSPSRIQKARETTRAWKQECREQKRAQDARRRSLKLDQTPDYCSPGTEAYAAIQDAYDLAEQLSEITGHEFHVDHKIPLAEGGLHEPSNLTPLRADLNTSKGASLDWTPPANEFAKVTYRVRRGSS